MLFRFDDAGLIESACAVARGAAVRETNDMEPWEVPWRRTDRG